MTKHAKIYLSHFDIGIQDVWQCEACAKQDHIQNFDIHHIHGRGKSMDVIENIMCLCRKCHTKAHASESKSNMQYIHNSFMSGKRKAFFK